MIVTPLTSFILVLLYNVQKYGPKTLMSMCYVMENIIQKFYVRYVHITSIWIKKTSFKKLISSNLIFLLLHNCWVNELFSTNVSYHSIESQFFLKSDLVSP
jgi:hypothetical protein